MSGRTAGWFLRTLSCRLAVVGSGAAAVAVAVPPDPTRPVLVLAGAGLLACLVAALVRWRLVGTLAVLTVTAAVLLAGALDDSTWRPLQSLVSAGMVVALVAALAAREELAAGSADAVVVARGPWGQRLGVLLPALGAGGLVAVTAAQDVVPSVPLVLAGLAAAVTALVVAAGVHRS